MNSSQSKSSILSDQIPINDQPDKFCENVASCRIIENVKLLMTNAQKEVKNASRFSLNHENQALLFESSWIFTRQPQNLKKFWDSYDFLTEDPEFYWHGSSYFELTENLKSLPHPDKIARMIVDQLLLHSVKINFMAFCSSTI